MTKKHNWDFVKIRTGPRGNNKCGLHDICPTLESSRPECKNLVVLGGVSMERTEQGKKLRKEYESGEIEHGFNEHRQQTIRKDGLTNTLDTNVKSQLIGAIRGRNPQNPKSRQSGLHTEQMLEINDKGTSNTLTSVQKDNVVIELDTPYSMGSAKPGRSTLGCRAPEIGTQDFSIRRLTEIECERLQGFEDGWTQHGIYDGEQKIISATQRYKMLGNAVTVDVAEAVGRSILNNTEFKA